MSTALPTLGSRIEREQSASVKIIALVTMCLSPFLRAAERGRLLNQLKWSERNVELLAVQIKNDQEAIRSEHAKQVAINSRLAELG